MIILTLEEAQFVVGPSPIVEYSALEPVPLPSGEYVLPEDVPADPSNADVKAFLEGLPVREILPEENWDFGTAEEPDEEALAAYEAARLTWSETETTRGTAERSARIAAEDAL